MNNEEYYPECDTLVEAIEAVRENTPLRFVIIIMINEQPIDGVCVKGMTVGDNEEMNLETAIQLLFGESQVDIERFQKFNAFEDRLKFLKSSNRLSQEFECEINDNEDEYEEAEELVRQILICLHGYPESIEYSFQPFSTNCPYCDFGDECHHLFACKELENCSFESDYISLEEIEDAITERAFKVYLKIKQNQNWYEQLQPADKTVLFEGDHGGRVEDLVEDAYTNNDESSQELCQFNVDEYQEALFSECPNILEFRHESYGDSPIYSMQIINYWSGEPEEALEWIRSEIKKDVSILSKIEDRLLR